MNNDNLEESDDSSDEEYIPGGEDCAQLSEVESDGEPDDLLNSDSESTNNKKRKGKTKRKVSKKAKVETEETEQTENKELNEEEQKKKTDSLWQDFLKDTDFKPKPKSSPAVTKPAPTPPKPPEKPKQPVIFEFAGEKIDSEGNVVEKNDKKLNLASNSRKPGGLGSVLSQIGKKQKIGTLEKSKIDWDRFKRDENIGDELRAHNTGRHGFLERQDFLQRADQRQFELEREARALRRTHRP